MSVYSDHKPSGSDDLYLKPKDGDKIKLRLASEPAITVFKPGDKPRYAWVVFNRDKNKPQVYGAGVSVYSQIADLEEEWGSPTTFDVVLKRTGSGPLDTSYSITPIKQSEDLTAEEQAEVAKIDLLQAVKGKWLADYIEDRVLPPAIMDAAPEEVVPAVTDKDMQDEIKIEDIPF